MNDRYLFKAKDCNSVWRIGLLVRLQGARCAIEEVDGTGWACDSETLCQCTGLKDKNGTLIWENDIVKGQYKIGKVGWNETHLAFTILANVSGNMQYYYMGESLGEEIEVIGSIFDNPELPEVECEN